MFLYPKSDECTELNWQIISFSLSNRGFVNNVGERKGAPRLKEYSPSLATVDRNESHRIRKKIIQGMSIFRKYFNMPKINMYNFDASASSDKFEYPNALLKDEKEYERISKSFPKGKIFFFFLV